MASRGSSYCRRWVYPGLRPALDRGLLRSDAAPARLFTTCIPLRAVAAGPAARGAKPKLKTTLAHQLPRAAASPSPSPSPSPSSGPAPSIPRSRYAFIKSLGSRTSPTMLYEGPSHFWFYFGCWSSGIFLLGWTALTGPTTIDQPADVPQWVPWVFGASYMLLGGMGFYVLTKTPGIVSSIRILPSPAIAGGKPLAPGTTLPPPRVEVTVKRMLPLPLVAPKVITTDLDKLSLKTRFSLPSEHVPELRRQELEREERRHKSALFKFDMEHLLTMPFRRLGRALAAIFNGVKSAWTDAGFGKMEVDGKVYKVDVTKGYAHDGFRTLERIVRIGERA